MGWGCVVMVFCYLVEEIGFGVCGRGNSWGWWWFRDGMVGCFFRFEK